MNTPLRLFLGMLALTATPAMAQTPVELPSLLQRVGQNQGAQARALAQCTYTGTTRNEDLDSKGKPTSVSETIERISWENGAQRKQLVKASRDGLDVTREETGRREKADTSREPPGKSKQQSTTLALEAPTELANQPRYRFSVAGTAPGQPGGLLVAFEPRGPATVDTNIGEALIDSSAASVSLIRFHPAILPAHTDSMSVAMEYAAPFQDGFALSSVTIEGEGGILFIHKRFRIRMTYSDYTCAGALRNP